MIARPTTALTGLIARTLPLVVLTLPVGLAAAPAAGVPQQADAAHREPTAEGIAFFESKVRPLLATHCYSCHANSADRVRGGLKLDSLSAILTGGDSGPSVVPGDPDHSPLVVAVRYTDRDLQMPPKRKLGDADVAVLEQWVRMGAPHPDAQLGPAKLAPQPKVDIEKGREHWAFRRPAMPAVPAPANGEWALSPVDSFVLASLDSQGLKPAADADRATWLRRVSFDLTGLPPTPDELRAFERDRSPKAYETVVDRLLASPQFGERWGRHWLDVARYAESSGKENNTIYPHAWRYRDYVIASFNQDKPFDEFLKEQLAGDLLPAAGDDERAEHLIATGYLAVGPKSHATRGRAQFQMDVADEQIDAFSQGMLGLTVSCARCHDHKFDPIPQSDYYAVAGIFLSTETRYGTYRGPGNQHPSKLVDLPEGAKVPDGPEMPSLVRTAYERTLAQTQKDAEEFEAFRAAQGGNRRAMQEAAAKLDQARLLRLRNASSQAEALSDVLARYAPDGKATDANRMAMGVVDRTRPMDAPFLVRGELEKAGDPVPRGFVQVISDDATPEIRTGSGRLELAEWVASEANPLTARVWANRVWLHLFGAGIVRTPDNFGLSGTPPTHPELLDWLALRLVEGHWSTKSLVRELVLSRTYRMSSRASAAATQKDPDNLWLSHMPKRRLEAEAIRDAMLAVSGTLRMAPPVASPVALLEGQDRNPLVARVLANETPVRSVYLPAVRDHLPEMLDVFDMADPSFVSGDREETSVATQALYMMNSADVANAANAMAKRLMTMEGSDTDRVRAAFELAYGRRPTQGEFAAVKDFFGAFPDKQKARTTDAARLQGWTAFCQALFQGAEFRTLD